MAEQRKVGYDDTPMLPNTPWHVHDGRRPQPPVVNPGASWGEPPADAVVLFDGTNADAWKGRDGDVGWRVENGYLEVVRGTCDIETRKHFADCQLHLEFACPAEVSGQDQGRGNSGVFLMGQYEVQVLDGYHNLTYADGLTAAIYGQYPPLVNACRPPGAWQAYDILFRAPRYDGSKLVSPACITVLHNGIAVHHAAAPYGPTGHRNLPSYYPPHPDRGPLRLQDHGDPVRYRNIWIRELKDYDQA